MTSPVLVLVEHAAGAPDRLSLEALALARRAAVDAADVEAILFGADAASAVTQLGRHGVRTAHVIDDARLASYAPDGWATTLAQLAGAREAVAVIGAASERGNEVLARVAARLDLPLAANVIDVTPGERWQVTRQRWAGSILEDAWLDGSIHLLTVAAHAVAVDERPPASDVSVVPFSPELEERDLRVRVTGHQPAASDRVSLTDARVVVGGGRGVGSGEAFAELEALATELGGAVGGSRVVTSAGWRPHADQIGQTGLRIAPDLYIACGISGAIQHIVGCKAAKRILAINTDPDAPIMGVADYAVIGDLHTVVPAITDEIRRRAAAR
jgi:electron transfer flavoprotein alpha subunit